MRPFFFNERGLDMSTGREKYNSVMKKAAELTLLLSKHGLIKLSDCKIRGEDERHTHYLRKLCDQPEIGDYMVIDALNRQLEEIDAKCIITWCGQKVDADDITAEQALAILDFHHHPPDVDQLLHEANACCGVGWKHSPSADPDDCEKPINFKNFAGAEQKWKDVKKAVDRLNIAFAEQRGTGNRLVDSAIDLRSSLGSDPHKFVASGTQCFVNAREYLNKLKPLLIEKQGNLQRAMDDYFEAIAILE